jgi:transaldolase
VTGLTSNPTIFDHALKNSTTYDADISRKALSTQSAEDLFFELALADLTRAAELFQPVFARTDGVDGWVSLEVSPLLAHNTASTLAAARGLHRRSGKANLFIKIPGTAEGLPAIEAAIFAGVPVNVTLLFSREQYVAAAAAYLRGVERRIAAGLNPAVASVASLFCQPLGRRGQWQGPRRAGQSTWHRDRPARLPGLSGTARFSAPPTPAPAPSACSGPAPAPRIRTPPTSSTSRLSPRPSPSIRCRRAPSRPSATMAKSGRHSPRMEAIARRLANFIKAGIDIDAVAARLQDEGTKSFVKSWNDLMACIESKSTAIRKAS